MVNVKRNESLFERIWVVNRKERLLTLSSWLLFSGLVRNSSSKIVPVHLPIYQFTHLPTPDLHFSHGKKLEDPAHSL